jgi:site-specific recombinase XerD
MANDWLKKDPFTNYKISVKPTERPFLSEEELNTLINKKFKLQRLELVKDSFLFSCFTGLAHTDLKKLKPENIKIGTDGNKWVMINRTKTDSSSHIPVLPITAMLIEKYKTHPYCQEKGVLLPVLTNQKMNAYLKEIADLCEIDKNLTSHIARHTFATTVTLNNDVPIETVSKMLGHSSIKMTKIYAKLLDKKVGRDMAHLQNLYNC